MARSAERFGYWAEHNAKHVIVDGIAYTIHAHAYTQRYPFTAEVITVHAEPCNTQSKTYRAMRAQLGDDWQIDLLVSDGEVRTQFLVAAQAVSV